MAEPAQNDFAINFSDGKSIRNGHGISLRRVLAESNTQIWVNLETVGLAVVSKVSTLP
jgi:hypothetical protein